MPYNPNKQSNKVMWYQAFLSNANNLHTVVWFQVFLIIIFIQLYDFK